MKAPGIYKFTLWFYITFLIISLLGYIIFRFIDLSVVTLFCYFLFTLFFILGITVGRSFQCYKFYLLNFSSKTIIRVLFVISAAAILLGWKHMINYYGSIPYIIAHAFTIRSETIGNGIQIIPTYVSYLSSFANSGLVLSLSRYFHKREKENIYLSIGFIILVFFVDLQSFGRVGILFVIFVLIGCIGLFNVKIKFSKLAIYGILALVVLMLPRWFRGGSNLEGVAGNYVSSLRNDLSSIFEPFVSLYAYYFSGIFAFNELLEQDLSFAWGERNFSSLINLYHRLFDSSGDYTRITIIAQPSHIPYEHNIYTILGEAYMDFGFLGLTLLPFFFGACIGFFFKFKGIYADALKLVFIGWIFYTPIYNLFSFGGFMLAFIFLFFLTLTIKDREG